MDKASVLIVHNRYRQSGGEDQVFESERRLLEARGHRVMTLEYSNENLGSPMTLPFRTVWNSTSARDISATVREHSIDVVHFHNTLPLVSPSGFRAARRGGAAVVQTLHNYRMACPGALMQRAGSPCESCVGSPFKIDALLGRCYRGSLTATAGVVATLGIHRALGTWNRAVDRYLALSDFGRDRFIREGIDPERIGVKPNFLVDDPGQGPGAGGYLLFAGRLTPEKGIRRLIDAHRQACTGQRLVILGEGPLAGEVAAAASAEPTIEYVGPRPRSEVLEWLRRAEAMVVPSLWYEGLPLTIIESFAAGTPVLGSALGAIETMVTDNRNGRLFDPGDLAGLVEVLRSAALEPMHLRSMRAAARQAFEARYTHEQNYRYLVLAYESALESRWGSPLAAAVVR